MNAQIIPFPMRGISGFRLHAKRRADSNWKEPLKLDEQTKQRMQEYARMIRECRKEDPER